MGRAIEFPPAGYLTYINIERHPPIITENAINLSLNH